ncbi:tetratricopeptide repeat-containing sensor histidine kinase [Myroides phaeus]|uniref:tetratricopeptide repeat-containing sensor histidine kinase n=1 Tax=Myroides phaeus TaxID=702745 RepID=UPI001303A954|nr:tetratricopeptide repeat-containing sensor histidine kinase [Myroides phaeus]
MNLRVFIKKSVLLFAVLFLLVLYSCQKRNAAKLHSDSIAISTFINKYDYYRKDSLQVKQLGDIEAKVLGLSNTKENREIIHRFISKTKADKVFSHHLLKYAEQAEDSTDMARAYMSLGKFFENRFKIDSSYYFFTQAEQLFLKTQDSLDLEEVYIHKAELLTGNSIYGEAENQMTKSIGYGLSNRDSKRLFQQCCIMGEILVGLGQNDEAIDLYNQAYEMLDTKELRNLTTDYYRRLNRANIHNNVSRILIKQERYELAITSLQDAIDKQIDFDHPIDKQVYSALALNLAIAQMKSGELSKVSSLANISMDISTKFGNLVLENLAKLCLAEYNYLSNKPKTAHSIIKEVLDYAEKEDDFQTNLNAVELLLKYEEDKASENFNTYLSLQRRAVDENNLTRNKFSRIKYEATTLEKSNIALKQEKNTIVVVSGILFLLSLLILLVVFYLQRKRKLMIVRMLQGDTERYYNSIIKSHNEMSEAQESERNEIAKELHDGVLNKLFITRFSLMQLEEDNFSQQKNLLVNELKDVENYLRGVSHALANENSMLIEQFVPLLRELVELQNRNLAIKFRYHIDEKLDIDNLSHHCKINIYRILQEVLQNVQKHSEATKCYVTIKQKTEDTFEIEVNDNGKGFDQRGVKYGQGLLNIKERTELIGGQFEIKSSVGVGTIVLLVFKK